MGRPENGLKKHDPRTARHGGVRASGWADTTVRPCLGCHLENPSSSTVRQRPEYPLTLAPQPLDLIISDRWIDIWRQSI
jgi:hypothetical protein